MVSCANNKFSVIFGINSWVKTPRVLSQCSSKAYLGPLQNSFTKKVNGYWLLSKKASGTDKFGNFRTSLLSKTVLEINKISNRFKYVSNELFIMDGFNRIDSLNRIEDTISPLVSCACTHNPDEINAALFFFIHISCLLQKILFFLVLYNQDNGSECLATYNYKVTNSVCTKSQDHFIIW